MEWLLKTGVFAGPVVLGGIVRGMMLVVRDGPELAFYDADRARFFDISVDLLLASTSILFGLLLYLRTNTLNKPNTTIPITYKDIHRLLHRTIRGFRPDLVLLSGDATFLSGQDGADDRVAARLVRRGGSDMVDGGFGLGWTMLDSRQILQVFLAAIVAVAALWALSQVASFILSHILVIGMIAMVCAALGIWYLSPQNVEPKA